jgi:ribosomal peptide maturation radical SAM protein 1
LGALKAFVMQRFPAVAVTAEHVYLQVAQAVGYRLYQALSERTWLAEPVYAALLYPERAQAIEKLFRRAAAASSTARRTDFHGLVKAVAAASDAWLAQTDWSRFRLVGFSSALCQLTAALYLIRRIKVRHPGLSVVVGGASFSAGGGSAVLDVFPEIDAVVTGEGELPLAHLVQHRVVEGRVMDEIPPAGGLATRRWSASGGGPPDFNQLQDLDGLPVPDFDDYFKILAGLKPERRFFPTLPIEASRGCWWQRSAASGAVTGCAFCNLNLQWRGYRAKSAARVRDEIDTLSARHRILSLALVDNVLPKDSAADLLRGLAGLGRDFTLFAEIRATTPPQELELMRAAGLRNVQVGIEALSSRLLRKLHKGTTAIENLEIMRHCEELGLNNLANVIAHFPASDEQDIRETLRVVDYAEPFRPLKFTSFWLGAGSPVQRDPESYGIRALGSHPRWSVLFPPEVFRRFPFVLLAYRGQLGRQRRLWLPVKRRIRRWEKHYRQMHRGRSHEPILGYRDGGDFLIIRRRMPGGDHETHRLAEASREIFLFCTRHRALKRIIERFPDLSAEKITAFLYDMTARRLMFAENERYLSLAVRER